jgi:lysophospholipase L1-like esterase
MKKSIVLFIGVLIFLMNPSWASDVEKQTEVEKLPRVLIMGDSITHGYADIAIKGLKGKCLAERLGANCAYSANGVANIDSWFGEKKWDIIHFNFGLWDMYGWKQKEKATVESYAKNLEFIVKRLKKSGTKLIFATTTPPCPKKDRGANLLVTDERAKAFSDAALKVMNAHGVEINDLYAVVKKDLAKYQKPGGNNIHYRKEGSAVLGAQVVKCIEETLK